MQAVSDAFPFTNYSVVFRPILRKFGTDNLSGSERELMVSEFLNLERFPWKSGNADFQAQFNPDGSIFSIEPL